MKITQMLKTARTLVKRSALAVAALVIGMSQLAPSAQAQLPVTSGLQCWFDAGAALTNASGVVTNWVDQSGNGRNATAGSGSPTLALNQINSRPSVLFRSNNGYLNLATSFACAQQYVVFRSPNATFSTYGAVLGSTSARTYLFGSGNTSFNDNPVVAKKNGATVTWSLAPITNYMVAVFNSQNPTTSYSWQINRCNGYSCDLDIAEIIGYTNTLSSMDEAKVGGYLASKYFVTTTYTAPLTARVSSPFDGQQFISGSSVTGTVTVLLGSGTGPYTNVSFFTDISGGYVQVGASQSGAGTTFTQDLGTTSTPDGTYHVYATVTDNAGSNVVTSTNSFTLAPAVTTTNTLSSSANPSTYGQSVTFTATITPKPNGGTVQFYTNSAALGTPVAVVTSNGTAQASTTLLPVGTANQITASYSGYGIYLASSATTLTQTVNKATLTVTADNKVRNPGVANPAFTYVIAGYQNSETLATAGVTGTPVLGTVADTSSPAGNYPITNVVGTLSAANYSFTAVNGTLVVVVGAPPVVAANMVAWFDASTGVTTNISGQVTIWNDQSGYAHHGRNSGVVTNSPNQINGRPAMKFRGSYLNCDGTLFAKEQYVVVRSPTPTWTGGGAFFARKTLRPSGYNMAAGSTTFYPAESPAAVSWNGAVLNSEGQGNSVFNLAPIDQYMLLKIDVNDGNTAPTTYTIANADTGTLQCDIAEIIAYNATLSAADEAAVGSFLATKYGLITAYPDATPQALIKRFGLLAQPAVINSAAKTIAWTVQAGTAVTALAPAFTVSSNATCDHVSGTAYDFSSPVHYIVRSSDSAVTNDYTVTVTVDPKLSRLPVTTGLACWFDAGDGVSTNSSGVIQYWNDLSGNGLHAIPLYGGVTTNAPGQLNGRPVARFRGNYLGCGNPYVNIKQQFVVFRSLVTPWAGGAVFGRRGGNPERSYLFSCNPNALGFDQDPGWGSLGWVAVNGAWVPQGTQVGRNAYFMTNDITQYMVFRIDMLRTGPATYQIGRCSDTSWPGGDVAEIIGYTNLLSTADEKKVGGYLASKYAITTAYPPGTPDGLTATGGYSQISLSWASVFGATSYNIWRSTTSGSGYVSRGTTAGTAFTDSPVSAGPTFYYVVTSTNSFGASANSVEVSAKAKSSGTVIMIF